MFFHLIRLSVLLSLSELKEKSLITFLLVESGGDENDSGDWLGEEPGDGCAW